MKKLSPQTAVTDEQVRQLLRDVFRTKHYSYLVGAELVTFVQRGNGPIVYIDVPKVELNRFTRWYVKEQ